MIIDNRNIILNALSCSPNGQNASVVFVLPIRAGGTCTFRCPQATLRSPCGYEGSAFQAGVWLGQSPQATLRSPAVMKVRLFKPCSEHPVL
ncbi:MAG: hypothetical protein LBG92_08635 [Prevotellaceae bacterium]|nr:hypothetical protein [Prevotellaceae bacterium]